MLSEFISPLHPPYFRDLLFWIPKLFISLLHRLSMLSWCRIDVYSAPLLLLILLDFPVCLLRLRSIIFNLHPCSVLINPIATRLSESICIVNFLGIFFVDRSNLLLQSSLRVLEGCHWRVVPLRDVVRIYYRLVIPHQALRRWVSMLNWKLVWCH